MENGSSRFINFNKETQHRDNGHGREINSIEKKNMERKIREKREKVGKREEKGKEAPLFFFLFFSISISLSLFPLVSRLQNRGLIDPLFP